MTNPSASDLMVAVIIGGHNFEVPEFTRLFRAMPGLDCYPQTLENFAADLSGVREQYDALVFYNMHAEPPTAQAKAVLEALGERPQGLVFLHHGLLAYRNWGLLNEILDLPDRSFKYSPGYSDNETIYVEIADPNHPITQGLQPFTLVDETYGLAPAGPNSRILLTTHHPKSMPTLAWARTYKNARVFALALGHGKTAYQNPNFQTVLQRGIAWAAGKI